MSSQNTSLEKVAEEISEAIKSLTSHPKITQMADKIAQAHHLIRAYQPYANLDNGLFLQLYGQFDEGVILCVTDEKGGYAITPQQAEKEDKKIIHLLKGRNEEFLLVH